LSGLLEAHRISGPKGGNGSLDTLAYHLSSPPSYKAQRSRQFCLWLSGIAERRLEPDPANGAKGVT